MFHVKDTYYLKESPRVPYDKEKVMSFRRLSAKFVNLNTKPENLK